MYEIIKNGKMTIMEIDCCFKQLVNGVAYLHSMGVAHRYAILLPCLSTVISSCSDLKPENLLIDAHGHLKITDFGVSDVFRTCWEKEAHKSKGLCGSEPYIAPEEFTGEPYDATKVDIWSVGIIYYAMLFHGVPWRQATLRDPNYAYFLEHRGHFEPFTRLPPLLAQLLEHILEPDPTRRYNVTQLMEEAYFKSVDICSECIDGKGRQHHHYTWTYEMHLEEERKRMQHQPSQSSLNDVSVYHHQDKKAGSRRQSRTSSVASVVEDIHQASPSNGLKAPALKPV